MLLHEFHWRLDSEPGPCTEPAQRGMMSEKRADQSAVGNEWDRRYASHGGGRRSGPPNGSLVAEVESRAPGRALEVGGGKGSDAIWLALRGWDVTAIDISQVALDLARSAADAAGVTVDWVRADILTDPPAPSAFDLVCAQYPALRHT